MSRSSVQSILLAFSIFAVTGCAGAPVEDATVPVENVPPPPEPVGLVEDALADSETVLRVSLSGIMVEDQAAALKFYTEVLGFRKKMDLPAGEYRWLTLVSPREPDGAQLALEPNANPAGKTYQTALREQGIPANSFGVADVQATFEELKEAGVEFTVEPTDVGSTTIAIFDDTCGNLIQIHQE